MDNAPLVLTTNSSVTAEGALAGIATDCDVIIRDSAAFSSGGDWGGIRLCDSLSTGAIGSGGASLTLAGATEITGGPDSDLAASGQLLIDLTRGGSVQAAGVRSGTAITCGDKTCIVTPENGFIGPCTDGGNGQTCYTVFAPAQGDTPSTVAEEVAFACTEDGPTYTVTFDSNGGSPVESQTVLSGSCAQPPEEPTWDGALPVLGGRGPARIQLRHPVTADLTLTAVRTGGRRTPTPSPRTPALAPGWTADRSHRFPGPGNPRIRSRAAAPSSIGSAKTATSTTLTPRWRPTWP